VKLFETATLPSIIEVRRSARRILEGRVEVSNNFAKQRRDDFKIGTRDN